MAWFVRPIQKKGATGRMLNIWQLGAEDQTALEAQNCVEAKNKIDQITGMPIGDYGWDKPKRSGTLKEQLIQDLHAGISRRDWHAVEQAANRLRDET